MPFPRSALTWEARGLIGGLIDCLKEKVADDKGLINHGSTMTTLSLEVTATTSTSVAVGEGIDGANETPEADELGAVCSFFFDI